MLLILVCCFFIYVNGFEDLYSCVSQLRSFFGSSIPQSLVVSVFDANFAPMAIPMAEALHQRNFKYFGVCKDEQCISTFKTLAKQKNCVHGLCDVPVFHCPLYKWPVENSLVGTKRCHGWREIQFVKVFALRDLIHLGIQVTIIDLDFIHFVDSLKHSHYDGLDVVVHRRDGKPWPQYWNFATAVFNPTANNRVVLDKLVEEVFESWDQAAWNSVMFQAELREGYQCKIFKNIHNLTEFQPDSSNSSKLLRDLQQEVKCEPGTDSRQPLCLCGFEEELDFYSIPSCGLSNK